MNPVIIIPTYWGRHRAHEVNDANPSFDHVEGVESRHVPGMVSCLASLATLPEPAPIIICLSCDAKHEPEARRRLEQICATYPNLEVVIVGSHQARLLAQVFEKVTKVSSADALSMYSYGSIKNVGLAAACVLGHDTVIFLDDDEEILDTRFIDDALFDMGKKISAGEPVYVKSGYFLDKEDSPYSRRGVIPWSDRAWNKHEAFNQWMSKALTGKRMSISNIMTGGCCAIHIEVFSRIPFDPWITRGEDLDYLITLKGFGIDVWFDNAWRVRHLPPRAHRYARRFLQDVFRWIYQVNKVELANARIDLHKISPQILMPYPGPWLEADLEQKIKRTLLRKILFSPERRAYLHILMSGLSQAREHAQQNGEHYFKFQTRWRRFAANIWGDDELADALLAPTTTSSA